MFIKTLVRLAGISSFTLLLSRLFGYESSNYQMFIQVAMIAIWLHAEYDWKRKE